VNTSTEARLSLLAEDAAVVLKPHVRFVAPRWGARPDVHLSRTRRRICDSLRCEMRTELRGINATLVDHTGRLARLEARFEPERSSVVP